MAGCFFIGHRDTPDTVLPALAAEVERHIMEDGVTGGLTPWRQRLLWTQKSATLR